MPRRIAWHIERLQLRVQRQGLRLAVVILVFTLAFALVEVTRWALSHPHLSRIDNAGRTKSSHHVRPGVTSENHIQVRIVALPADEPAGLPFVRPLPLSKLAEFVQGGDMETIAAPRGGFLSSDKLQRHYRLHGGVKPLNDIPVSDKLRIALEMAGSLALLHGFPAGLIVHDDIQPSQFLRAADGSVKLNDFNRAEVMLWDEENREYCRYFNGVGRGVHRSPEEYHDRPIDENIDTYSLGNIMYMLLTGLHPFYDSRDENELRERVKTRDEVPFVDDLYRNGTFAEQKLLEIMERCMTYEPHERPSIFDVVDFLEDAVEQTNKL